MAEAGTMHTESTMEIEYGCTEDLSYSDLDAFPQFLTDRALQVSSLQLDHNSITVLPRCVSLFQNLVSLDISSNNLGYISKEIIRLTKLRAFNARNNNLDDECLPKEFGMMTSLKVVNLAGNRLTEFPTQLTQITGLQCIYLGANRITKLPKEVGNLKCLQVMYLGGNRLSTLPSEVGLMDNLVSLILCDNRLESLPPTLALLQNLQSLSLHGNRLSTLPPTILELTDLEELSLRNNPLVVKFVQDMVYEPPSLMELAGRVIKIKKVPYTQEDLPRNLYSYLKAARRCVNPKCKGVYFTARVEQVKFVDFCGKYRLPLLEYLCSPNCSKSPIICSSSSEAESEEDVDPPVASKLEKVLLPQHGHSQK